MSEEIDRWVEYMQTHPDWKKKHTAFIDAQFQKQREFVDRLARQPGGKDRIKALYDIRNEKAMPKVFSHAGSS